MKTNRLAISLAVALALALPAAATLVAAELPEAATPVQVQATGGYLGVVPGPVPEALRTQLGSVLPPGQGVLVREVADDSPAALAGLRTYDILLSYNDQKLFSADQLRQLVLAESPQTTVTLRVVRAGTTNDVKVTLAGTQTSAQADYASMGIPWMPTHRHHLRPHPPLPGAPADNWESFDSLSLQKLQDGRFKAEIQFLGTDGKLVRQEFTGSRDEIRAQVMKEKDLPPIERNQLLEALSARDDIFMPGDWYAPRFYLPPWLDWPPSY